MNDKMVVKLSEKNKENSSRYIIGIDLGTTNSCVSYVDCDSSESLGYPIHIFSVPQFVLPGVIEKRTTLPSFCYLLGKGEFSERAFDLPWEEEKGYVVGAFARDHGSKVPTRLVHSAKSWLCNSAADRKDKILPYECAEEARRLSPIEATSLYLCHIKKSWNSGMAKGDFREEFEQQEIILTVPASFDEVARALTVEAARLAGFSNVTLLEEPQAAFYHWIAENGKNEGGVLKSGDRIVVCDVGGGTTDFSLIDVSETEGSDLGFARMSVGRHLLLGGDNIDLSICHYFEKKIRELGRGEVSTEQWLQLKSHARAAKEALFDKNFDDDEGYRLALEGSGSSIVGGSICFCVSKKELEESVLGGFFPKLGLYEALSLRKGAAVRSMGLPYESDPAVTKHLAVFLKTAMKEENGALKLPNYILFNGGSMKPGIFQKAIIDSMAIWGEGKEPKALVSRSYDFAVARGAAYFGKVRRGMGTRIKGGSPRGYYLAVDVEGKERAERKVLTLLPRGCEEGTFYKPDKRFFIAPNVPVSFEIFTSQTRLADSAGEVFSIDEEEFSLLPPLHTTLRFGKKNKGSFRRKVPVALEILFSEIGVLELWLSSLETDHKWNLIFQLRSVSGQDDSLRKPTAASAEETFESSFLEKAKELIKGVYGGLPNLRPIEMMRALEDILGKRREEWNTGILRGLWESLYSQSSYKERSVEYYARWWNLAGFLLRPGFGYPLDDFRVKDLWRIILGDVGFPKNNDAVVQRWICYRRIAGGLNKGQQMRLAKEIQSSVLDPKSKRLVEKGKMNSYEYAEKMRALGSLELIDSSMKESFGHAIFSRIREGKAEKCDYWAFGRIGARHLVYGSIANVLSRKICEFWLEELTRMDGINYEKLAFVVGQLARKTDQRELNVSEDVANRVMRKMFAYKGILRLEDLIQRESSLTKMEEEQIFGEKLPAGLILSC